MSYQVLYRKYRSQNFADLVGQDHIVKTLQNSISAGRLGHAYLFTGPRGTGKTSTARLLAKAINCEKGPAPEPCNVCETCISITQGNCIDVHEMDAASESGVDTVREHIVQATEYEPMYARYKVFIIDEVHDLSPKAFDALLKTIEEPPPHVVFILATTEFSKVPTTIRARCQRMEFHLATVEQLCQRLRHVIGGEGFAVQESAINAIARLADGGYRDALSLLEQAMFSTDGGELTLEHVYDHLGLVHDETVDALLLALASGEGEQISQLVERIYHQGRDPLALSESLLYRLSELGRAAYRVPVGSNVNSSLEAALHATATRIGAPAMARIREELVNMHSQIKLVTLPRIWFEAKLLGIAESLSGAKRPEPAAAQTVAKTAPSKDASKAPATQAKETAPEPPAPSAPVEPVAAEVSVEESAPEEEVSAELAEARDAWKRVVEELSASSRLVQMKLAQTRVEQIDEGTAVISFVRENELDWLSNSPNRRKLITEKLSEVLGGSAWTLTYALRKNPAVSKAVAQQTVELPAEGDRLKDMGAEVFNGF